MSSKWIKGGKAAWSALTGGSKVSPTITSVKIAPHITTKRNIQDKVVKAVDEGTKEALGSTGKLTEKGITRASRWKRKESKRLKEFSYEYDRIVAKKKKK